MNLILGQVIYVCVNFSGLILKLFLHNIHTLRHFDSGDRQVYKSYHIFIFLYIIILYGTAVINKVCFVYLFNHFIFYFFIDRIPHELIEYNIIF